MPCGYHVIDGEKFYVPDCWGGLYDISGCYCKTELTYVEKLELKIERLEKKIEKLENGVN